ncbi:oligosaccharyl transferase glycoprotein complex, beta subunit [Malassezia sp. CBS 17886]|nr:oligosaccharyl transferase glycoprotein complex, beta subunit [Malassezia sp. CBS 17886]
MNLRAIVTTAVCAAAAAHAAVSATGDRVLVVLEDPEPYAPWLKTLERQNFNVTLGDAPSASHPDILFEYGERKYDHAALLIPTEKTLRGDLAPQTLVRFLQDGGNLLVGLSPQRSEAWRAFAREFGIEFGDYDTHLVDHVRCDDALDDGDHSAVLVGGRSGVLSPGGIVDHTAVFSPHTLALARESPLVFRGIAHWLGPNPLAFPLLLPPATAYQTDVPKIVGDRRDWVAEGLASLEPLHETRSLLTGLDAATDDATASLASAVQLRDNSARAVFVGSTELLQSAFFTDAEHPATVAAMSDIVSWTFQQRGVLRLDRTAHRRLRAGPADVRPEYEEDDGHTHMYRVKDTIHVELDLEQLGARDWEAAPLDLGLQLSATMLDPYLTVPLSAELVRVSPTKTVARYAATFRLPDRHGVYTLRVNWKRHGWSYILSESVVPVRPFNHDEYPRMLSSSWPYISGAFSTMLAFVGFAALWLLVPQDKVPGKQE